MGCIAEENDFIFNSENNRKEEVELSVVTDEHKIVLCSMAHYLVSIKTKFLI